MELIKISDEIEKINDNELNEQDIIYKEKYQKYKNKYIHLKYNNDEFKGGVLLRSGYYYLFYVSDTLNIKKKLLDDYRKANPNISWVREGIKKLSINPYKFFYELVDKLYASCEDSSTEKKYELNDRITSGSQIATILWNAFYIHNNDAKFKSFFKNALNVFFSSESPLQKKITNISDGVSLNFDYITKDNLTDEILKNEKNIKNNLNKLREISKLNYDSFLIINVSPIGNTFIYNKRYTDGLQQIKGEPDLEVKKMSSSLDYMSVDSFLNVIGYIIYIGCNSLG
jgi:hypothetical protein